MKYRLNNISEKQAKDTGMAMVLICLLLGSYFDNRLYFTIAIPVLLINMTVPKIFKPAAVVWFGFSHILGSVVSRILLSIVYYAVVTPTGLIRKMLGHDPLLLKKWKKNDSTVFISRDHKFQPEDIVKPY